MNAVVRRLSLMVSGAFFLATPLDLHSADRFDGIDQYVQSALKTWDVPGLAIAVVRNDKVVLARGYGVSQLGTDRVVNADTLFHLASCEKSFVATAVGLLVEEGKVNWDDPVKKHLPELELADSYLTEHVTLRDLLCHRTGLRRADLLADGAGFAPELVIHRLKFLEPIAELRTRLIYNNHMYTALGQVVARVSEQPWEQFVAERVFAPIGMTSTTTAVEAVDPELIARRHWRSDDGIISRPIDDGLYSSVTDVARWLRLQLAEGSFEGTQHLKPETIREMHAMQFSVPVRRVPGSNIYAAQFLGSGLGWHIQDYRGHKVVSHAGAWGAIVAMMPEERLGVVVLSNLDLEYLCTLLMYDAFDAYLASPKTTWNQDKWKKTWLRNEPPGAAFFPRDRARAQLERSRRKDTKPSLPLEKYANDYNSMLYGLLSVQSDGNQLSVTFGRHTTRLSHWHDDSFYARAPTRLTFDWLLTFARNANGEIQDVTVKHVGWDKDEKDHVFVRHD